MPKQMLAEIADGAVAGTQAYRNRCAALLSEP